MLKEPDNLWVKEVTTKYLTRKNFMEVRKASNASRMWKYILDHRYLLKKGIRWCLRDGHSIKFWQDNWMDDSPWIDKVSMEYRSFLNLEEKVSRFINMARSIENIPIKFFGNIPRMVSLVLRRLCGPTTIVFLPILKLNF